jgi:formate/nitrite transporter FocA (FNT family)
VSSRPSSQERGAPANVMSNPLRGWRAVGQTEEMADQMQSRRSMRRTLFNDKGDPVEAPTGNLPQLTRKQRREAAERTSVAAMVVHEAVRQNGILELRRSVPALAWSGLAAGLSMGFSFLAEGLFRTYLPDAPWRPLLTSLGYPLGFLIVIIGRQQLFTENTLTAIIPLLANRDWPTFRAVLRLWGTVLIANLAGAHIFALVLAHTPVLKREFHSALLDIAMNAASVSWGAAAVRGIFAGWLIAMVVWMLAATNSSKIAIIGILTYIVGLAELTHVIVGSAEVLYLVMTGRLAWLSYLGGYMAPSLIGNVAGGVALVSALNHAQVVADAAPEDTSRTPPVATPEGSA